MFQNWVLYSKMTILLKGWQSKVRGAGKRLIKCDCERGGKLMENKVTIYDIVVHTINLILLGAIGLLAFFSMVNISPKLK